MPTAKQEIEDHQKLIYSGTSLNLADIAELFGLSFRPNCYLRVCHRNLFISRVELQSASVVEREDRLTTPRLSQVNRLTRRLELGRHPHQVGEGIRLHLLHDLATVCLYRDLADSQFPTDLFV